MIDVRVLTLNDFYSFYATIKQSEDIINNAIRKLCMKKPETDSHSSFKEDECVVCISGKIEKIFKCTVYA